MILHIAKYATCNIKSVNFKESHIENRLMHLTETFAVNLLQIVVSDVNPKQVLARILLIETKIINFSRLRWLKTVSSTFQDVDFDGSLLPLFIN